MLLLAGIAAINAMGCTLYASHATGPRAPGPQQSNLSEGSLCLAGQCAEAILVQGAVTNLTVAAIRTRAQSAGARPLWVCLNSVGGDHSVSGVQPLPANVRTCVADIAGDAGQTARPALCASACAWIWMAGNERAIFGRNMVGFHRPYVYDSGWCSAGNWFKAFEGFVTAWVRDRYTPGYEATQAQRVLLRWTGLSKGPTEAHYVDARLAREMGLQGNADGQATFVPGARQTRSLDSDSRPGQGLTTRQ